MVANSVSVAVAMVLSTALYGAAPAAASGTARPLAPSTARTTASTTEIAAAGLWAPKKSKPKPKHSEDDSAKEEELLRSRNAPRAPASRSRARIKMEDSGESASEESEEEEEEEEEEEDRPKRKRKRVVEEEEDEEEEEEDVPLPSLPVIRPRLAAGFLGAGVASRSFKYDTPLQGDSGYRMGVSLALELYPLLRTPPGGHRRIGVGFNYAKQSGTAGRFDMATGSTLTYPVDQSHWGFDLRYFFVFGPHVVLAPAAGYGRVSADLGRRTPVGMPSACLLTNADPCFADLNASYASFDLHLRIAATPTLGFSLVAGYLLGLGVKTGADQISSPEASATLAGFHADVGASLLIKEWFAVQATIPIRRYAYKLAPLNTTATYHGATDLYWGVIAGLAFLAP